MNTLPPAEWIPLRRLASQFEANTASLRTRDPRLADAIAIASGTDDLLIQTADDRIRIGRKTDNGVELLPNPVPPVAAQQVLAKLCANGYCTQPILVAGLDQGWLWDALYAAPIQTPAAPGHRPPLYFLSSSIERLRIALHLHDWRQLLGDARVQLFAGPDAVAQVRAALTQNDALPWPKLSVTIEPSLWASGASLDTLVQALGAQAHAKMQHLRAACAARSRGAADSDFAARSMRGGLRVLGITSRYTTFLQHSMRDWLAAFAADGHETRLVMESADHEQLNALAFARECEAFRPDLVVLIDHYRAEFGAALPAAMPCVMWIQDRLPNIFNPSAGAAQKSRDYVIGFGRQECVDNFGYPRERFLPTRVGVNTDRFAPRPLSTAEQKQFTCDVSYVSHASEPADRIVAEALGRCDSSITRRLVTDIFDRLRGLYDGGGWLTEAADLKDLIRESMAATRTAVPDITPLMDLFLQRVNNALFRHQTLSWLADLDMDLRLYGRGWDAHPRFARFARGVADNQTELSVIYQASRINLQATPHGAVHQRLTDGLATGGFFLIRYCPADVVEDAYRAVWNWCLEHGVRSDEDLKRRATPEIQAQLAEMARLKRRDPFSLGVPLVTSLTLAADGDYTGSAKSIWTNEYPQVSFDSPETARQRVQHFLSNPADRVAIAAAMRQEILDRLTYTAITRRTLAMIAGNLDAATRPAREMAA